MPEIIVTFQNKKSPEVKSAPTQVPVGFAAEEMEKLLNTILEQDKAYAFFFAGQQITAIPDLSAEAEQTVNIEYITVSRLTMENAVLEADAPITCISIRTNEKTMTGTVVICTLNGSVREYSLTPGMEEILRFESYNPIRGVTSTEEGLFITTVTNKVVDVEREHIIYESDSPIRTTCVGRGMLVIGLDNGDVVIMKEGKVERTLKGGDAIGKVLVREYEGKGFVIFGTVSGVIHIHEEGPWTGKKVELSRPITALGYCDGKIYTGGVGGLLTICTLDGAVEQEVQSDETFISRIEAGTCFVGYSNENRVLLRDKDTFTGTHKLMLTGIISDMKISSKQLFVSEGAFLRIFNVFDE